MVHLHMAPTKKAGLGNVWALTPCNSLHVLLRRHSPILWHSPCLPQMTVMFHRSWTWAVPLSHQPATPWAPLIPLPDLTSSFRRSSWGSQQFVRTIYKIKISSHISNWPSWFRSYLLKVRRENWSDLQTGTNCPSLYPGNLGGYSHDW